MSALNVPSRSGKPPKIERASSFGELPPMPPSLDDLQRSVVGLPQGLIGELAVFIRNSGDSFRGLVRHAENRLGGVAWSWPLLEAWNDWCLDNRIAFYMWRPVRGGLDQRTRLDALVHTIMMLPTKAVDLEAASHAGVVGLKVYRARNRDCRLCISFGRSVIRAEGGMALRLPPFHPGCRCTVVPVLKRRSA